MNIKKSKAIDLAVLLVSLTATFALGLELNLKPLALAIVYIVPISIYLALRERKNFQKIFWAVLIFGGIFGFFLDLIQTYNQAWFVPDERLLFPWRILNVVPFDDFLGFLFMTLITVMVYEHFLDDEKNRKISKNINYILLPSLLVLIATVALFLTNPESLTISHVYLKGGLAAIMFPVAMSFYRPKLIPKFIAISALSFFGWFAGEIMVLKTNGWTFPGEYIGNVHILGVTFPWEELIFWMVFYSATIVAYYEFFVDDAK